MTLPGWILLALVGITLFGFAVFEIGKRQHKEQPSEQANYANERADETHQQDADDRPENVEQDRKSNTDLKGLLRSINEYSGALLAAFTAILAFATWLLWMATRDLVKGSEQIGRRQIQEMRRSNDAATKAANVAEASVKQSQESAYIDQRAWVLAVEVTTKSRAKAGEPIVASLEIKNAGRTPANNTKIHVGITMTHEGRLQQFAKRTIPPLSTGTVIVPGASIFLGSQIPSEAIREAEAAELNDKTMWVFVYGTIEYETIGSGKGQSGFCYIYEPNKTDFIPYEEGNYAK